MASYQWKDRSNRTPFTDLCLLIDQTKKRDKAGYEETELHLRQVFCNVLQGVTRAEFYEAYRAGVKVAITVEVWEDDYGGETLLEHESKRYEVVRSFPTGNGTLELTCKEVLR